MVVRPGPRCASMPLATFPSFWCFTHTRTSASRYDSRQETYAVVPHVRICAGGGEQSLSLPRPSAGGDTTANRLRR
jgi:hypothetical protein